MRGIVGAIAGLVGLLADGRVPAEDHARVMNSLHNSAARAATLAREVGQIARWSQTEPGQARHSLRMGEVLDRAVADVEPATTPIALELDTAGDVRLPVSDAEAIVNAFTAMSRAVRRVSPDGLACRVRADAGQVEVMFGPTGADWIAPPERRPFDVVTRGGLGVSLLLAAMIFDAHGGRMFQDASGAVIGVCLPLTAAT